MLIDFKSGCKMEEANATHSMISDKVEDALINDSASLQD